MKKQIALNLPVYLYNEIKAYSVNNHTTVTRAIIECLETNIPKRGLPELLKERRLQREFESLSEETHRTIIESNKINKGALT